MLENALKSETTMSGLSPLDYIGSSNDVQIYQHINSVLNISDLIAQREQLEKILAQFPRFNGWKVLYPTLLEKAYEIALDEVIASVRYVPLHSSSAGFWDWEIRWGRNQICEPAWTADHAIAQVEKTVAFFQRDIWNEAMDEVAS
ncbi:hypothetical protein IPU75_08455 [Ochrobactrum sp. SD129]|nr:hypothetical protein [Ochrobactrum sp. SD129]